MDSNPTLHDFVLNLITDQDARLQFELDPEGALRDAGLGDLTPADVQEVVPLVVDLVPVQGITSLLPVGQGGGLGILDTDPSGVVNQLTELTRQLSLPSPSLPSANADLNVSALGAITIDPAGLGGLTGPLTTGYTGTTTVGTTVSTSGTTTADLSTTGDLSHTLDLDPVTGILPGDIGGGLLPSTDPVVGSLDVTLNTVTSVVGDVTGGLGGTLGGLTSGDLLGTADAGVGTVTSVVGDVSGGLGGTVQGVGGLTGSLTGSLTGTASGSLTGDLTGSLGLGGEAHTTSGSGLLGGLTDGLL